MARPSMVAVSMPCSMTCSPIPRSRSSEPRVTRCKTERESRSSRVTLAHQLHDEIELRPGRLRAAGDVDMDVVAVDAVAEKRVDLMIGVLVGRRSAAVAKKYCRKLPEGPFYDVDFRRGLPTVPTCGFVIAGVSVGRRSFADTHSRRNRAT